jgi:hypothetical protein
MHGDGWLDEIVRRADLDELVRAVDAVCDRHAWDELLALRNRCRAAAAESARPLWPIASLAEYRLALDAPGPWSAGVVNESTGRFVLGPLTEVAASTHTWAELTPHLDATPSAAYVAHERVVRGEDLRDHAGIDAAVLELPLVLQGWEPRYCTATYHHDRVETPAPTLAAPLRTVDLPDRIERLDDPDAAAAFRNVVAPWVHSSNGRCDIACAAGDQRAAIAALGLRQARTAEIDASDGLAWLAWAGASGGAFGNRRGMAAGRWEAWWLLTELTGLRDEPAVDPDQVGDAATSLRWWAWDAAEPATGWTLRLAIHDPVENMSWAVSASDTA